MRFDTQLLPYLPEWFRQIEDYQYLCLAETGQMEALAREINVVADNFFCQTMDEGAVSQWEKIFGILPDLPAETLPFRRERVLNRLSTRPPYTLSFLYQKLDEFIGRGQWSVAVDYPNYTLYIESSARNQAYASEVAYTIGKMKPAHIVYINTPLVSHGLALAETIELSQYTYHYKLGGWGLGMQPFATEQGQGVIKMPATPSIQTPLLNAAAGFVSAEVAKARINGSIVIDSLTKEVNGNTATIRYTVAEGLAPAVTLAELLDKDGSVLTASPVYVPISSSTVMKHTIPVTEGAE